jgi:hypothetical protein
MALDGGRSALDATYNDGRSPASNRISPVSNLRPGDKIYHQGKLHTLKSVNKPSFINGHPQVKMTSHEGSTIVHGVSKRVPVY